MRLLERDELIAVCKPAGMPSHPLRAGERGTAAGGIVAWYPECAGVGVDPREAGLVHRLDGDTTGVLVAARDQATWEELRAAFGRGAVHKTYLALTAGAPRRLRCDAALSQRGARVVVDEADGLPASTSFEVLAESEGLAWVRCTAHTGRMHQVRAHLAACGAPLVADLRYGGPPDPQLATFVLHAAELTLPRPDGPLAITAPLPAATAAIVRARGLVPA
ncbi:MAG: RNA pseudouridine synthase [Kofleriaceae bacterium]